MFRTLVKLVSADKTRFTKSATLHSCKTLATRQKTLQRNQIKYIMENLDLLRQEISKLNINKENFDIKQIVKIIEDLNIGTLSKQDCKTFIEIMNKISDEEYNFYNYKAIAYNKISDIVKTLYYVKLSIKFDLYYHHENVTTSSVLIDNMNLLFNALNLKFDQRIAILNELIEDKEFKFDIILSDLLKAEKNLYCNEIELALDLYLNVVVNDKSCWYAFYIIGYLYYHQNNPHASINYFKKAISLLNENADESYYNYLSKCYYFLANNYGIIKNYLEESKAYMECLKIDPSFEYAKNNLAYSLYRQGNLSESLKLVNDCIKDNRDGEFPYFNKIRILKKMKKYEEALKFISKFEKNSKSKKNLAKIKTQISQLLDKSIKNGIANESVVETEEISIGQIEDKIIETEKIVIDNKSDNIREIENEKNIEIYLEQCIINGSELFGRKLQMFNKDGYGRQYWTPIGRIDLLTVDEETNDIVIIELKKGISEDSVFGQTSRYLGYIKEKVALPDQKVIGIIYVYSASDKLKYQLKTNTDIYLHEYKNGYGRTGYNKP